MTARRPIPEFLAPLPLLAVALMAVNDAWLKPRLHDALTGKLSDVALCFFLPTFLSALLAPTRLSLRFRLRSGGVVTAAAFTLLKCSPVAAARFVSALKVLGAPFGLHSFRATVDPTDLLALPFVLLSLWHARRLLGPDFIQEPVSCAESSPSSSPSSSSSPPRSSWSPTPRASAPTPRRP